MFCKWNLSLVLSLLVSLTSISTADAVGSVPEPVGVYQRPPPIDEQEQCVPFHHHYCSKFGYSQTISPNPWARDLTLEQATNEFSDFNDLLRRNCSDKLGTFLCFTYFPLCYKQPSAGERRLILPCKETCEAVHNSECNDLVMGSVGEWGKHLQCSNFHTKTETENGNCADGQQKVWTDSSTENKGGDGMKKEDVVPPMVLSKETTENCGAVEKCQNRCSVREKCTARTLKINHYAFVAKVFVVHKLESSGSCKHAYQVEVMEQFNISSLQPNSELASYAPAMENRCIIHTSPVNCAECPALTAGNTYLIAGQYHTIKDGITMWELPNGKKQSLVSEWKDSSGQDYDKKLRNWIAYANLHKLQKNAN